MTKEELEQACHIINMMPRHLRAEALIAVMKERKLSMTPDEIHAVYWRNFWIAVGVFLTLYYFRVWEML